MTKKIAIIGSGISGLTAAYLLNKNHDITLFEKEKRLGGHTATIDIEHNNRSYAIDTGFIVFNDWTYPNFIELLSQIGVASQPTSMGFAVSCDATGLEYSGENLNTIFAQRKNMLSPKFYAMLRDIIRFNREARNDLQRQSISADMSLGEYLEANNYSDSFSRFYLVPMGAAIWSASLAKMKEFPVHFFVQFFHNHGLLNIFDRPQWHVIKGGSKEYITPLTKSFADKIFCDAEIKTVERSKDGVILHFNNGEALSFDDVVFATHSDQALDLLQSPSDAERDILEQIPYCENSVVLHTDTHLLPKIKKTWSSWNYRLQADNDLSMNALPVVTYNMNILQGISSEDTFCVTLNADELIDESKILGRFRYAHPQFSVAGIEAQKRWQEINGVNHTWFCGAYWANGFHEDGVVSALRVAECFGETL